MPIYQLPGGTDVAELALFDVDAAPVDEPPDREGIDALEASRRLVDFRTGGDGGYLLDLYVDEAVPEAVRRYCARDEMKEGTFLTATGAVAFGGVESAYQRFEPNANIRCDASIKAGRYAYSVCPTDFPDELVDAAIRVERNATERWISRAPPLLFVSIAVMLVALVTAGWSMAAGVVGLLGVVAFRWLLRHPIRRELQARRHEAQLAFPTFVMKLRSLPKEGGEPAAGVSLHARNAPPAQL